MDSIPNAKARFLQEIFRGRLICHGTQNDGIEQTAVLIVKLRHGTGVALFEPLC
jgi:hypothetical protein